MDDSAAGSVDSKSHTVKVWTRLNWLTIVAGEDIAKDETLLINKF